MCVFLCTQLESTSETNDFPDPKMALQKDYFEELQKLLDESHAAVIDLTSQLKVCESNWNCEPRELLKHFSKVHLDWKNQSKYNEVKIIHTYTKVCIVHIAISFFH